MQMRVRVLLTNSLVFVFSRYGLQLTLHMPRQGSSYRILPPPGGLSGQFA